jgi:hypothetical protein
LIRWGWLLAVGLALQVTAALVTRSYPPDWVRAALIASSYGILVVGVSANLRYLGFRLLLANLLLNAIVIGANGWRMPVDPIALERTGYRWPAADSSEHGPDTAQSLPDRAIRSVKAPKQALLARAETTLWPLADVIPVAPAKRVVSPGDCFVYLGMATAIWGVGRRAFYPRTPATTRA